MAIDRHHRKYKTKRDSMKRRWAAECAECGICLGKLGPIDYTGPAGAPLSCDLDHRVPVCKGGSVMDPANWAPSHATCNRSAGAKEKPTIVSPSMTRRTTVWGDDKPVTPVPKFRWQ